MLRLTRAKVNNVITVYCLLLGSDFSSVTNTYLLRAQSQFQCSERRVEKYFLSQ